MRIYQIPIVSTAFTAAVDIVEINPTTNQMCKLLEIRLGQSTELGDAQDEELPVSWVTGFTTGGSAGGGAVTPVPDDSGDSAWGGTAKFMSTTQANTGTIVTRILGTWKIIAGEFLWLPVPIGNETPAGLWIPYNTRGVLRVPAPADSITMHGYVKFGVVGGA